LKRWEGRFFKDIHGAIKGEFTRIAGVVEQRGILAGIDEAQEIIMVDGLGAVIQKLYQFAGVLTANRTLREINRSAKAGEVKAGFGFDELWQKMIAEYFKLYLLTKAVLPISAEIRKVILETLQLGVTEGWSVDKMAYELLNHDFPLTRARLVTRTELVKAQFYGEELGVEASEWETEEMWISTHDHRVRSSHRKADGQTIASGGRFKVERIRNNVVIGYDMMKGPGDPEAHIENIANCRCVRSVVVARDERGRLIRKQKKLVDLQREFA
jgi:hypothetical protein